jgi:hypothetical protein
MFPRKLFTVICVFVAILAVASVVTAAIDGLTVNSTASISPGRTMLMVSGTVTCPVGQTVTDLFVDAIQQRGSRQTRGSVGVISYDSYWGAGGVPCTGSPISWEGTIGRSVMPEGLWQPGPVSVKVTAAACTLEPDPWGGMGCNFESYGAMVIDARIHAN